jgi:hypothetical protein
MVTGALSGVIEGFTERFRPLSTVMLLQHCGDHLCSAVAVRQRYPAGAKIRGGSRYPEIAVEQSRRVNPLIDKSRVVGISRSSNPTHWVRLQRVPVAGAVVSYWQHAAIGVEETVSVDLPGPRLIEPQSFKVSTAS